MNIKSLLTTLLAASAVLLFNAQAADEKKNYRKPCSPMSTFSTAPKTSFMKTTRCWLKAT